jgi:hypothetical protein
VSLDPLVLHHAVMTMQNKNHRCGGDGRGHDFRQALWTKAGSRKPSISVCLIANANLGSIGSLC